MSNHKKNRHRREEQYLDLFSNEFIYIVSDGYDCYKVGKSKNPFRRCRRINEQVDADVFLVGFYYDINQSMSVCEKQAHSRLSKFNHPYDYKNGAVGREWFRCDFKNIHDVLLCMGLDRVV